MDAALRASHDFLKAFKPVKKPRKVHSVLRNSSGVYEARDKKGNLLALFGHQFAEAVADMVKLQTLVCDKCGSDNSNSLFAKNVGDCCRQFGCFGNMVISKTGGTPKVHKVKRNVTKRQQKF